MRFLPGMGSGDVMSTYGTACTNQSIMFGVFPARSLAEASRESPCTTDLGSLSLPMTQNTERPAPGDASRKIQQIRGTLPITLLGDELYTAAELLVNRRSREPFEIRRFPCTSPSAGAYIPAVRAAPAIRPVASRPCPHRCCPRAGIHPSPGREGTREESRR